MKISCNVIKDLLPLYYDEVCSKDSSTIVEEHIAECADCKRELEKIKQEIEQPHIKEDETKIMGAIASEWKRENKKSFAKGATITMTIFSVLSAILCVVCLVSYNIIGSTVLPDGTLSEPFFLIPLAYLFLLIGIISLISLGVIGIVKRFRHPKK